MNYIYDVLLNFTDNKTLVEFYEWLEDDTIEHIKKIPIFRTSTKTMGDLLSSKIQVTTDFLKTIKNQTIVYNSQNLKYAALFTDLNRVVALEFNDKGLSVCKSSLLLDEEEDVIDESSLLSVEKISYKVVENTPNAYFLTREERFKRNYLLNEFKHLYENKDFAKFNYLYEEIFSKDNLKNIERYQKVLSELTENYSAKYDFLYEIVKLSYTKK